MKTIPKMAHGDRRRNAGLRPRFCDTETRPSATHAPCSRVFLAKPRSRVKNHGARIRTSAFHHFIPPAEISRRIQQFAQLPGAFRNAPGHRRAAGGEIVIEPSSLREAVHLGGPGDLFGLATAVRLRKVSKSFRIPFEHLGNGKVVVSGHRCVASRNNVRALLRELQNFHQKDFGGSNRIEWSAVGPPPPSELPPHTLHARLAGETTQQLGLSRSEGRDRLRCPGGQVRFCIHGDASTALAMWSPRKAAQSTNELTDSLNGNPTTVLVE